MIVCPLYHGRGQKKSAPPERSAEKHSDFTVFLERAFEPFPEGNDPGPGQKVVDQQRCDDANGGIEDAVESVAHIGLNGSAEQNDAEHHWTLSRFFTDSFSIAQSEEGRQAFSHK